MGKKGMVDNLRSCITNMKKDICNINIAILLEDLVDDTYTLLIASKFLDLLSPREGTKLIVEYLFNNLSDDDLELISRVTLVNTQDNNIKEIKAVLGTIDARESTVTIERCTFFDVFIEKMIIFECHLD
ncbi:MAG: hypothetical protein ACLROX_02795 [Clostridium sp.]|uniref:hypothetical protein n=1 Tax=Clostridium sp. TaxID=1506 RepID=UPI0039A0A1AA